MTKHNLADFSWQEAAEVRSRNPLVLIPFGTTEQNGTQNPLSTDTKIASYFARRVAEESGNLYLPPVPYGYSAAFRNFPGTVWLQPDTLRRVVEDVLSSLLHNGFNRLLIVNNHGPNEPMMEHAIRTVQDRYPDALIPLVWPAKILKQMLEGILPPGTKTGHGSEPTTSLMLAIDAASVSLPRAKADTLAPAGPFKISNSWTGHYKGAAFGLYTDIDWLSSSGIGGSPEGASAERGQTILDRLTAWGLDFVASLKDLDPSALRKNRLES